MTNRNPELQQIVDAINARQRFVLSSHSRPDGDSIGSQLAMAYALRALGKDVHLVNSDKAPGPLQAFPGVPSIEIADHVSGEFDAAIIMECGDLARTGVSGLDRSCVINIDHHPGNSGYGQINWFDSSAAACGEMVFEVVRALGVPLSREIATHIYLAILTDTGSFHFSHNTPRTIEIARRCVEAGADPQWIARTHYDSSTIGRVKIFGAVLDRMQLDPSGRVAVLTFTDAIAAAAGATYDDTEGLINLPLTVKDIQAVALFKEMTDGGWRVSLRSKGDVDVRAIASQFGGGGHVNAAGCSARGELSALREQFMQSMVRAIDASVQDNGRR